MKRNSIKEKINRMEDVKTLDRIIGSCLEINADIVYDRVNSKLPKFLADLKASYYRKKLIKTVNKMRSSDLILTRDNLAEFFTFTFNNFPDKGQYGSVFLSKVTEYGIEAIIKFDNPSHYSVIITIDNGSEKFDINYTQMRSKLENISGSISCDRLYTVNLKTMLHLDTINTVIKNDICDYIISVIKMYEKEKGYAK